MPYDPDTGYLYVPGTIRTSVFSRVPSQYATGQRYTNGTQAPPIGSPLSGTFTAIDSRTNKIAWQHQMPYRMGGGGGSTVIAGGLLLRGEPDGNFVAVDSKTGEVLSKFQTGFGADAPPMVYEVDGDHYIAIVTGGNSIQGSAYGDAVWAFRSRDSSARYGRHHRRLTSPDREEQLPTAWIRSRSATTTSSTPIGRPALG